MRKLLGVIALILAMLFSFCGCSSSKASEDRVIDMTSDWKIIIITTGKNGTTDLREDPWLVRLITQKDDPRFTCDDFGNCTMKLNGKERHGVVTDEGDGMYTIEFYSADGSSIASVWNATIEDNTLTMTSESGDVSMTFEAQ